MPPYVDLAIFGPHGARLQRKMKLQGQKFTSDGKLGPIEIAGPPDLETWLLSWGVFKVAMLMLGAIDLGILLA